MFLYQYIYIPDEQKAKCNAHPKLENDTLRRCESIRTPYRTKHCQYTYIYIHIDIYIYIYEYYHCS